MSRRIGPFRVATWGRHKRGVKGIALSWLTKRLLLNLEFHLERRRP